ncbi:hypothetical protein P12x_005382 [Tundrisphaera lichenicola]|uniref:hypothetical protein n=1 Tax=Tundrisphaera lichenicola TaxID=2029860 RepID=UPI003EBFE075
MWRLIASLVACLLLAASLRFLAERGATGAPRPANAPKDTGRVVIDGVEYRATRKVSPEGQGFGWVYGVEARDPKTGSRLWDVVVRESPRPGVVEGARTGEMGGMPSMLARSMMFDESSSLRSELSLQARGRAILATSPDGGAYLVDLASRRSRQLKAPAPPPKPPLMDARARGKVRCEVHDRALREGVVPIRYGLGFPQVGEYEARLARFPNANSSVGGGCVVGPSSEARVLFCPDCRDSEREHAESPAIPTKVAD